MKIILRSYLRMYEDNSALLLRSTLLTLRTVLFKGYEGVLWTRAECQRSPSSLFLMLGYMICISDWLFKISYDWRRDDRPHQKIPEERMQCKTALRAQLNVVFNDFISRPVWVPSLLPLQRATVQIIGPLRAYRGFGPHFLSNMSRGIVLILITLDRPS